MKASEERITSLCSSLGTEVDGEYREMPDCQINFEELAYSIWKDDETLKNISILVYNLRTFEDHFIKLIFSENPEISFTALKALAACTYPCSSYVADIAKMNEIYQHYKFILVSNKYVLFKSLTYLLEIIRNPRSKTEDFQKAEVGFTFLRNVAVIKSPSDISERFFDILNEGGLFDIIGELQMKAFSSRISKFAPIIAGILYGCFVPFLPLVPPELNDNNDEISQEEAEKAQRAAQKAREDKELDGMINDLRKTRTRVSSRHGHWNSSLSIVNTKTHKGFTYNGAITPEILSKAPLPSATIKTRTRPTLFAPRAHGVYFSKKCEQAVAKVLWSQAFNCVFTRVLPHSFSAYDRTTTATQQLQMADLTRFFIEFILKYGGERRAYPLATEETIKFYLTMAKWYVEQRIPDLEGIPIEIALHRICLLFSSFCEYATVILRNSENTDDISIIKDTVSEHSKDIENFLITLLCNKFKSKATLNMIQDTIVALEKLYKLYAVAEDEHLSKRRSQKEDLSTNETLNEINDMFAIYDDFEAESIIHRLAKRAGVLAPFFKCIKNYDKLNEEELGAISTMIERFSRHTTGLAHIFKLPYFVIIDKLLNEDKKFMNSDEKEIVRLREILTTIVDKFFYNAQKDPNIYITVLVGPDDDDIYDEKRESRRSQNEFYNSLGFTQEERAAINGSDYSYSSDSDDAPAPRRRQTKPKAKPKAKPKRASKLVSNESDSDEGDELELEDAASKSVKKIEKSSSDSDLELEDEFPEEKTAPKKVNDDSSSSDSEDGLTPDQIIAKMAATRASQK